MAGSAGLFLVFLFTGLFFQEGSCVGVHPHFSNAPSNQALVAGKQGTIICEVSGKPAPPVPRWKRITGKDVEITIKDSERYTILKSGGLSIGHVTDEDSGKYVCFTSSGDVWMDKEIHLEVLKASTSPMATPSSDYTALYVFVGIISVIIVFVLVDLSCFLFNSAGFINCFLVYRERKRKHKFSAI